ncbi:MAG: YggS family pyridoxal phosphate-dependent enzyme [Anaerolineales bacterium]
MTTQVANIQANVAAVKARIDAACARASRAPDAVTLVAVSKKKPLAFIQEAHAAGILHFGENRLEEATEKIPQGAPEMHWHMVGHIQSRKAKTAVVAGFHLVHSLDSLKLAQRLARFAAEMDVRVPVLLEVNISGEQNKSGWAAEDWAQDGDQRTALWADVAEIARLPALEVRGLMTMAPFADNPETTRPVFRELARLRAALATDFPNMAWSELSMGMTNDFEIAIEEGATLVRIGRAIFGERA